MIKVINVSYNIIGRFATRHRYTAAVTVKTVSCHFDLTFGECQNQGRLQIAYSCVQAKHE